MRSGAQITKIWATDVPVSKRATAVQVRRFAFGSTLRSVTTMLRPSGSAKILSAWTT